MFTATCTSLRALRPSLQHQIQHLSTFCWHVPAFIVESWWCRRSRVLIPLLRPAQQYQVWCVLIEQVQHWLQQFHSNLHLNRGSTPVITVFDSPLVVSIDTFLPILQSPGRTVVQGDVILFLLIVPAYVHKQQVHAVRTSVSHQFLYIRSRQVLHYGFTNIHQYVLRPEKQQQVRCALIEQVQQQVHQVHSNLHIIRGSTSVIAALDSAVVVSVSTCLPLLLSPRGTVFIPLFTLSSCVRASTVGTHRIYISMRGTCVRHVGAVAISLFCSYISPLQYVCAIYSRLRRLERLDCRLLGAP